MCSACRDFNDLPDPGWTESPRYGGPLLNSQDMLICLKCGTPVAPSTAEGWYYVYLSDTLFKVGDGWGDVFLSPDGGREFLNALLNVDRWKIYSMKYDSVKYDSGKYDSSV